MDARTDLFSLGVLLYLLATGTMPFKGSTTMALFSSLANDTPAPVSELNPMMPMELSNLIGRMLSKKAAERPASAMNVAQELLQIRNKVSPLTGEKIVYINHANPRMQTDSQIKIPKIPKTRLTIGCSFQIAFAMMIALIVAQTRTRLARNVNEELELELAQSEIRQSELVPLFNGKNLNGLIGDADLWKIRDGVIYGTAEHRDPKMTFNTFLYTEKDYRDFEISQQIRVFSGNSGVQFRSRVLDSKSYALSGPQYECGNSDMMKWGDLWGEKYVNGKINLQKGSIIKVAAYGGNILKVDDFNDVTIRCVGKHVTMKLNGYITIDDDFEIPAEGRIGWQLHMSNATEPGLKTEVAIRNIKFTLLHGPAEKAPAPGPP